MGDIKTAIQFMIDIANDDSHGYDQTHRNAPDYDCSSLVGTALNIAGFNVSPKSWTGNLERQLVACGFTKCKMPWKAGDIHLKPNHHVSMQIDDKNIAHARCNELGKATGGKTGDQTGNEICIMPYKDYPYSVHYRYTPQTEKSVEEIAMEVIAGKWSIGNTRRSLLAAAGYNVAEVQAMVNLILNDNTKNVENGEVARDVIAGKYGNGAERKKNLEKLGYTYSVIQAIVNKILLED